MFQCVFLSTGGTSTGEPVCLSVCLCSVLQKKNRNRFRDHLTLRYFLRCVVSGFYLKYNMFKQEGLTVAHSMDQESRRKVIWEAKCH